ncbi:hypothetical protein NXS19_003978 [Fusarium pseudograminearum]|nr:hypothetical protein NXS19_003978 [Fusarium pseudograminearum]
MISPSRRLTCQIRSETRIWHDMQHCLPWSGMIVQLVQVYFIPTRLITAIAETSKNTSNMWRHTLSILCMTLLQGR